MSFLYPRTCTITRSSSLATNFDFGAQGYGGKSEVQTELTGQDVLVAADVPCSIQAKATGRATSGGLLPGDAPGPVHWRIFFPKRALAKGVVRNRDVVTDDLGDRYQVSASYWNSLGTMLDTVRTET